MHGRPRTFVEPDDPSSPSAAAPHPIAFNERMELVEANADLSVRQLWSAEAEDFRFGP